MGMATGVRQSSVLASGDKYQPTGTSIDTACNPVFLPGKRMTNRTSFAGIALLSMLLLTVATGLWPELPRWPAGACAWFGLALAAGSVPPHQRKLAAVMLTVGATGLLWALTRGRTPQWQVLLTANLELLAMLAGVSFLSLITQLDARDKEDAPCGHAGFRKTLLGMHFFSGIINISAVQIVGEGLRAEGQKRLALMLLSRGFSSAAFWSPFFAAMAVSLTYAPGSRLGLLLLYGLPLAAAALTFTTLETRKDADMQRFTGYPMHVRALWVPAALGGLVIALRYLLPQAGVLIVIALSAFGLSLVTLVANYGREGTVRLARHVRWALPGMAGEFALFLAAGILTVGLHAILEADLIAVPIFRFGLHHAALLLAVMILAAGVGVHPVVSIALADTLLVPADPSPLLLGLLFLASWALGVALSPFSGMHLLLHGRFGADIYAFPRWNWRYVCAMYLVTLAWLALLQQTGKL